ncbi:hypothetical protein RhiJN_04810 [Ceratobasidium sp. AG-Ba]|nr:hypothetical protein RhiJN_04810 [Ceratobasidium sp. AG-Ba]
MNYLDREDIASSKGTPEDLNSIKLVFEWGKAGNAKLMTVFPQIKENGPIHEKAAKKGHTGSVGLGEVTSVNHDITSSTFDPTNTMDSVLFVFRYGPEDWLQARGIMPSKIPVSRKRGRDAESDVIDIDDLETEDEDDEVIIIKHLVPAPTAPMSKRQKVQDEVEEGKEIKPKQYSSL